MGNTRSYKQLDSFERQELLKLKKLGKSNIEIAKHISRDKSTIGRELKRNKLKSLSDVGISEYAQAHRMHRKAVERRSKSRKKGHIRDQQLRDHVISMIVDEGFSPEIIENTLWKYFPEKKITAKTIYNFTKRERKDLVEYLCRKGNKYKQKLSNDRSLKEAAKRSIAFRNEQANLRLELGHWEVDSIHSARSGNGYLLTMVDRYTRKLIIVLVPNLRAETIKSKLISILHKLPPQASKTLTFDNGPEFAISEMQSLERIFFRLMIYYCDPYKAWQRPSIENRNAAIRISFPKKTDFSKISLDEVSIVQEKINNRPMKLHGYLSPNEVWQRALELAA